MLNLQSEMQGKDEQVASFFYLSTSHGLYKHEDCHWHGMMYVYWRNTTLPLMAGYLTLKVLVQACKLPTKLPAPASSATGHGSVRHVQLAQGLNSNWHEPTMQPRVSVLS
jgi:hypothetical protein